MTVILRSGLVLTAKGSENAPLHIFVAFRGVSAFYDLWTNAKFFQKRGEEEKAVALERWRGFNSKLSDKTLMESECHSGFFHQYESVQKKIGELVERFSANAGGDWDLLVTGHSMGGAVARICCFDLLVNIAKAGKTDLITFGSFPCGNKVFSDALDVLLGVESEPESNLHIVQNNDPIPKIAKGIGDFGKSGCCGCILKAVNGIGKCGCCKCCPTYGTGDYVHGGCLVSFDSHHEFLDAKSQDNMGRMACAYLTGFCRSKVNFPAFDHALCEYVRSIGNQCQLKGVGFKATFPSDPCEWTAAKLTFSSLKSDGLDGALRELLRYCGCPAAEPGFTGYAETEVKIEAEIEAQGVAESEAQAGTEAQAGAQAGAESGAQAGDAPGA